MPTFGLGTRRQQGDLRFGEKAASGKIRRSAFALMFFFQLLPASAGEVHVIANPSVTTPSISRNFARSIFGMRVQQWPYDGGSVKVFVLPDNHAVHEAFCKTVLDVFPRQMRVAWDRQVFSGTGPAPIEVETEEEVLNRVATTPGAVGYLSKEKIDEKKVRLLPIK
ncbi:MAG: hypothetical protein PHE55_16740 [Methylococcaceae bacterium]|nr:hypothetical protein [Methylococcaceae bacterium]